MKIRLFGLLVLTVCSAQAAVIVQWGEAGGTNNVVSANEFFNRSSYDYSASITTTYSESQTDVITGTSYYNPADGSRSPSFQVSASTNEFQSAQVQNNASYDRWRVVSRTGLNPTRLEIMAVWNDFLTTDSEVTSFSWYGYSAVADNTDLYFIIQKGGAWYASPGLSWGGAGSKAVSIADAGAATWYDFTPMADGAGAVGSVAGIDMTGVTAVGTFVVLTDGAGGNLASYNGYFQATATGSAGGAPSFSSDPISMPDADEGVAYTNSIAGEASDPEGDPLDFSKISGPAWLNVASNGVISGTPGSTNVGLNAFSVQVAATGGVDTAILNITVIAAPEPPTGWEEFVSAYSLSGSKTADEDNDGQLDVAEFFHGGDPTNPAVLATLPQIIYGSNDTVSFTCIETAHTNPGIPVVAEWTDNLVTGVWQSAWDVTNSVPAALPGYNEVERQLSGMGQEKLFFRNRLFNSRPNILVILMDDLGYCDVGFMADIFGEARALAPQTPTIDTLATNGVICTQAYVPHPFCGPSRMGLLTGRYPHHFGGSKNHPYETADRPSQEFLDSVWNADGYYVKANETGMNTNETTIAKVLQNAGYYTAALGKWHCGVADAYHPNNRGFDYWYGLLGGGHNYYSDGWMSKEDPNVVNDYQFWLTRNGVEVDPSIDPGPGRHYITDILSDDAVAVINNAPVDQPFFMYLCYNAPHAPMQGKAEDLIALFGGNGDDATYTREQNGIAMMHAVDRGVSNIVETLSAKGELDNTLIIFFSDNGGKEKDAANNENEADNGPFKGGKGDTYEGGVRTPMFIHFPNAIAAGTTYSHPIYPYDLYPTVSALAEADIPVGKDLDGVNVWDAILGDQDVHTDDTVFWVRHNAGANNVSMRKGNYKANRLNNGAWKLYNIVTDPYEQTDIASGNTALIGAMIADGLVWTNEAMDPLFHDTESGYWKWETNNMPNYATSFSQ